VLSSVVRCPRDSRTFGYTRGIPGKNTSDALKSCVERLRVAVRESMATKEQMRFLGFIDTLDTLVNKGGFTQEAVISTLQRARGATRKTLSENHLAMLKMLNGFDAFEEELMKFLAQDR